MHFNLLEYFNGFRQRTKIIIVVWTILNLLLAGILIFGAGAPVIGVLVFFLIWEIAIWGYYIYRYYFRERHKAGEWVDAILFAVIAATVIRSMFIELYQIPTSSMEKSLLVGDFLFVNKMSYGTRLTMTPLSFPFAHHTIPRLNVKAYSEALKFPYYRLPGFGKIKNGDVVVFNWPDEREGRPVDKKENYIKRCVAIPGDTLQIVNGVVSINGVPEKTPLMRQFEYVVRKSQNTSFGAGSANSYLPLGSKFHDKHDITDFDFLDTAATIFTMQLNDKNREAVKSHPYVLSADTFMHQPGQNDGMLFPVSMQHKWSRDFYGPLVIPKKGVTVQLDKTSGALYGRLIQEYEGHDDFIERNGKFYLGSNEITEYTFAMDYYFMMGDNRHYSYDSRFWGFVPEDHIVGKAWFVLWSIKSNVEKFKAYNPDSGREEIMEQKSFGGIRWDRTLMKIK